MFLRLLLVLGLVASPVAALELRGPQIAAATNFGQGWQPRLMTRLAELPLKDLRDAVYWARTDDGTGQFNFPEDRDRFPDWLDAMGVGMSLTVNNGHPAYDDGQTPVTPEGVAAFAAHAAEMVRRFPAIHTVEVGNEWNAQNFVSGAIQEAGIEARAEMTLPLLQAVYGAVKTVDPEIRILGGAAHSIPILYLSELMAAGGGDYMDALAFHPYTTPAEQLTRQIALLREVPGLEEMPFEVTEFGSEEPDAAPHYFLKAYCQLALSGVTRVVWYALNVRGDGLAAMVDPEGALTPTGDAVLAAQDLVGLPVADIAPDPFTYACRFGESDIVIWGAPRDVIVEDGISVRDATGATAFPRLSMERPLWLSARQPIDLGLGVTLGPQRLIADSYHQFAFPGHGISPFERFAQRGDWREAFETRPGQDRPGRPWTPHLAIPSDGRLLLTADELVTSGGGDAAIEIVHAYTATRAERVVLEAHAAPAERSVDGVTLRIAVNGDILADQIVTSRQTLRQELALSPGDQVEVAIGPGETTDGDVTHYRITLSQPD